MKYPYIKPKGTKTYTFKNIGGTVTTTHPAFIGADRLSDSKNVYSKNGILTTREGFFTKKDAITTNYYDRNYDRKLYTAPFEFKHIDGYDTLCAVAREGRARGDVDVFVTNSEGAVKLINMIEIVGPEMIYEADIFNVIFVKGPPINGSGIFIIICYRLFGKSGMTEHIKYHEFSQDNTELLYAFPEDFYTPLILKNGRGNGYMNDSYLLEPMYPEGVNLLNGSFEASFSADSYSYEFCLPVSVVPDCMVTIKYYTSKNGYKTFTISSGEAKSNTIEFMNTSVYAVIERETGVITFYANGVEYPMPKLFDSNGIRVFAKADVSGRAFKLFSKCTTPINFDNRLFIPGGEGNENIIYYSGKNNPLYFSDMNSFPLGNDEKSVTALSMQNRYVIAFKEREIYRISLSETEEYNKEELLESQTAKASRLTYKITRVNDKIGCDRPLSIQNCSNRLVWYHSDGKVYTLYGSNLYTDGSVYELSYDIQDKLHEQTDDSLVFSGVYEGYYMLGFPERIFLMDANVGGFRYLNSHKSESKDYSGLGWFIFDPPENSLFVGTFTKDKKQYFVQCDNLSNIFYVSCFTGEKDVALNDEQVEFPSYPEYFLATSLVGNLKESIKGVYIRAKIERPAEISLFDENGIFIKRQIQGSPRFKNYFIPVTYKTGSVGVQISGNGKMELGEINISVSEMKSI